MSDDPRVPRVMVALPMHDGEAYLGAAVASLQAQSYEDWVAVLVDDASTDGTHALACELAAGDPRLRVLRLERNVGVAGARDAAIREVPAEMVALLDQDDVLGADFLARCVALHDEGVAAGRRVGIVAPNAWLLDEAGRRIGTFAQRYGWVDAVGLDEMIGRNCICARALFSREAYDRAGGFLAEAQPSDDYDLWLRMLELGYEVVTTRERLAGYRLHGAATSRDVGRMAQATLGVHRRALARGRLTSRQRRAVRARMRHHRALVARAEVRGALGERRLMAAAAAMPRAAAHGALAFAQAPSRWAEWLGTGRRGVR